MLSLAVPCWLFHGFPRIGRDNGAVRSKQPGLFQRQAIRTRKVIMSDTTLQVFETHEGIQTFGKAWHTADADRWQKNTDLQYTIH